MWWMFWPALVFSVTSTFGGSPHQQIRTGCNDTVAKDFVCDSERVRLEDLRAKSSKQATRLLKGAAIEHLYWDAEGQIPATDFTVGIVEFDDQGNEWNRGQIAKVRQALSATFDDGSALVVVFVHGWKNNCEACNGNLACFRETLALLAGVEQKLADQLHERPRKVFGLYVGWRGASATVEPAKEASVFSRKSVADRIGSSRGGTLTSLLSWLNAKRDPTRRTKTRKSPLGDMVAMVGHSFGADVLYGSIANALDASIAASTVTGRPAQPFGDLAVLVNPAFEASAYLRFAEYSKQTWPKGQLPLMVTVQARNDWATHYTFPITRTIVTLPQASGNGPGYRAMIDALGHHPDFYTHSLDRPPAPQATTMVTMIRAETGRTSAAAAPVDQLAQVVAKMNEKLSGEKCACDGTRASRDTLELLFKSMLQTDPTPVEQLQIGSPMLGLASYMTPCGSPNLAAPLLMVRADPAIVDGHSGITHAEFFDFLANFLVRVQKLRSPEQFKGMMTGASASMPPLSAAACR